MDDLKCIGQKTYVSKIDKSSKPRVYRLNFEFCIGQTSTSFDDRIKENRTSFLNHNNNSYYAIHLNDNKNIIIIYI